MYVVIIILILYFDIPNLSKQYVQKILSNFTSIEKIVGIDMFCSFVSNNYIYILSHYSTFIYVIVLHIPQQVLI